MESRAKYAPIKYKGGNIKFEGTNSLLDLLNELNKKISNDNVDMCDYEGMGTEIIKVIVIRLKISEISNELSRRNLGSKEEDRFNKATSEFDKLLTEFDLFCHCIEGKDPRKRKQWEKDFAERND